MSDKSYKSHQNVPLMKDDTDLDPFMHQDSGIGPLPGTKVAAIENEQDRELHQDSSLDFDNDEYFRHYKSSDISRMGYNERCTVEYEGEVINVDSNNWRHSTRLKLQICTGFLVFILFGLAEQTVGTLIPELQSYYEIDDIHTSFIFLSSVFGYFVMAILSEPCHRRLGFRGVMTFGTVCMTSCYLISSTKPPFPVLVFCYIANGFGFGSLDASLNNWMGGLDDANELLGILHGCYGIGCMISPPLITHLLQKKENPWQWNDYYLIVFGAAVSCTACFLLFFRLETVKKYRFTMMMRNVRARQLQNDKNSDIEMRTVSQTSVNDSINNSSDDLNSFDQFDRPDSSETDGETASLAECLHSKLIWIFSLSLFIYVGGEAAFGSWLVSFLMRNKGFEYKHSSYMATTFWAGLTIGRIVLGFVTTRFFKNELKANFAYIVWSTIGYLTFWLLAFLPLDYLLFLVAFFAGLGTGPIFPTLITSSINLLPSKYHTVGIGFTCAFGGGGAAAVPFLIGLIADSSTFGMSTFPLIIFSLFVILLVMWTVVMKTYGANYRK